MDYGGSAVRKAICWLLLLGLCWGNALAEGMEERHQYAQALACLAQEDYAQAYALFDGLVDYVDSASYSRYVLARYAVEKELLEQAEAILMSLQDFADSADWLAYAQGRLHELADNDAAAAAAYEKTDVLDASVRLYTIQTAWCVQGEDLSALPVLRTAQDTLQGVSLSWDSVAGADGYAIFRCEADVWTQEPIAVVADGSVCYVDETALPGQRYGYCVWIIQSSGPAASSNVLEVTRAQELTLHELTLSAHDATTLDISWTGLDNTAGYAVYATVSGLWRAVGGTSGTPLRAHTISTLAPGTAYTVYVQDRESGQVLSGEAVLAEAEAFRENRYRWQQCRVVRTPAAEAKETWRGVASIALTELDAYDYGLSLTFTWRATAQDKSFSVMTVLRTPDGDAFAAVDQAVFSGDLEKVQMLLSLEALLEQASAHGAWEAGAYACEVYFNGQLAGRAAFAVR